MVVGLVIVGNAICLGAEADHGRENPTVFMIVEHIFCALFFIELILHFWVEGPKIYFSDKANWLDFFLVTTSVLDVWIIQQIGVEADLKLLSLFRMLYEVRRTRGLRPRSYMEPIS